MNEEVIPQKRTLNNLVLEGKYKYSAFVTIGPDKTGSLKIKLEFINLDSESFKEAVRLYQPSKPLRIESSLTENGKFNVTHIIVEKFMADSRFEMTWECSCEDQDRSIL